MLKKFFSKIELIHLVILIVIVTGIGAILYINSSSNVKKFSNNIEEKIVLEQEEPNLVDARKGTKAIEFKMPKTYLEKKEYHNYITGSGQGYKLDFKILISNDEGNTYYETKTLKTSEDDENIYFSACVKDKYLNEQTKFAIFNLDNNKLYEY